MEQYVIVAASNTIYEICTICENRDFLQNEEAAEGLLSFAQESRRASGGYRLDFARLDT